MLTLRRKACFVEGAPAIFGGEEALFAEMGEEGKGARIRVAAGNLGDQVAGEKEPFVCPCKECGAGCRHSEAWEVKYPVKGGWFFVVAPSYTESGNAFPSLIGPISRYAVIQVFTRICECQNGPPAGNCSEAGESSLTHCSMALIRKKKEIGWGEIGAIARQKRHGCVRSCGGRGYPMAVIPR